MERGIIKIGIYTCRLCGKQYRRRSTAINHVKARIGGKPLSNRIAAPYPYSAKKERQFFMIKGAGLKKFYGYKKSDKKIKRQRYSNRAEYNRLFERYVMSFIKKPGKRMGRNSERTTRKIVK